MPSCPVSTGGSADRFVHARRRTRVFSIHSTTPASAAPAEPNVNLTTQSAAVSTPHLRCCLPGCVPATARNHHAAAVGRATWTGHQLQKGTRSETAADPWLVQHCSRAKRRLHLRTHQHPEHSVSAVHCKTQGPAAAWSARWSPHLGTQQTASAAKGAAQGRQTPSKCLLPLPFHIPGGWLLPRSSSCCIWSRVNLPWATASRTPVMWRTCLYRNPVPCTCRAWAAAASNACGDGPTIKPLQ